MNNLEKTVLSLATVGLGSWLLTHLVRRRAEYDFRDKVVLITGGSRGLGLVMGRKLTQAGARIAFCARDEEELEQAGKDLAEQGGWPLPLRCDLTQPDQVRNMIRAAEEHFGPIDVLINNAGIIVVGPLATMTRADFEQNLATNFWSAYNTVEAVLPGMRQRRQGRIVNISSIGGKISVPHLLPYSVSKFALLGYSWGLRSELAADGIVVTTICPGLMRTGSPRHAWFKGQYQAENAWFNIGDSLPLVTLSAEEAADQILAACRRGDAEAVLSLPAQLAVQVQALFPEIWADVLVLANRLLPSADGIGTEAHEGKDSESALAPSLLTALSDRAAVQNNQLVGARTG